MKLRVLLLALILAVLPEMAFAQIPDLNSLLPPGNGSTSGRIIQLMALITVLSVAPGLLIMVTSFTRFAVALSFLRSGLGLQTTPANLVLVSLALFMTFYVMAPTFDRAWETGVQPLMKNEISEEEAYVKITDPFREFMLAHVRDKDLQTFESLAAESFRKKFDDKRVDLRVIIPAFMISELRRSFEIGFLIILPFRYASAATLGPVQYFSIVGGVIVGYFWFAEVPSWTTVIGVLIVMSAMALVLPKRGAKPTDAVEQQA